MSFDDKKQLAQADDIEINEFDDSSMEDEVSDTNVEKLYNEHIWPVDDPTVISFKGKKRGFIKVVESLKRLMKKGNEKIIDKISFKVLDSRKIPHGIEYEVEVNKDTEKGLAVLKIYGPSTKKECSVVVNKAKKCEAKYVSLLALDVIKQLLDRFVSGEG